MSDFTDINRRETIPEIAEQDVQVFPDRVIMDPDLNDGSVQPRKIGDPIPKENTVIKPTITNIDESINPKQSNGIRMLTPEEIAQLDTSNMHKIGTDEGTFVKDDKEVIAIRK